MTNDLFTSKIDQLMQYCKYKKWITTHEIIEYGSVIKSTRTDRDKRILQARGILRRIPEADKGRYGYFGKDAMYEYVGINLTKPLTTPAACDNV